MYFLGEIFGYILGLILGIFLLAGINNYSNDKQQARCEAKGGTFFKAGWADHSLCKLPTK